MLLFDTEDSKYLFLWLLREYAILALLRRLTSSLSATITLHRRELLSSLYIAVACMALSKHFMATLTKWPLQILFNTYGWMWPSHSGSSLVNITRAGYSRLKPAETTFLILSISSSILLLLKFFCSWVFLWVYQRQRLFLNRLTDLDFSWLSR